MVMQAYIFKENAAHGVSQALGRSIMVEMLAQWGMERRLMPILLKFEI